MIAPRACPSPIASLRSSPPDGSKVLDRLAFDSYCPASAPPGCLAPDRLYRLRSASASDSCAPTSDSTRTVFLEHFV